MNQIDLVETINHGGIYTRGVVSEIYMGYNIYLVEGNSKDNLSKLVYYN